MEKPMTDAYGNPLPINPNASIAGSGSSSNPEKNQTKTLPQTLLTGGAGVLYLQRIRMYNMRRRFYNGLMRRFVSNDAIADLNRYRYAKNNPTNYSDPSGLLKLASFTLGSNLLNETMLKELNEVINKINTDFSDNSKKWHELLCKKCPAGINYENDTNLSQFKADFRYLEIGFDFTGVTIGKKAFAYALPGNLFIYFNAALLSVDFATKKTLLVHEIMHSRLCNSGNEECCNWLAIQLGYNSFPVNSPEFRDEIKNMTNILITRWNKDVPLGISGSSEFSMFKSSIESVRDSFVKDIENFPTVNPSESSCR
jgi:RHS repeat-associated protein